MFCFRRQFEVHGGRSAAAWARLFLGITFLVTAAQRAQPEQEGAADLILHNGEIVTVDRDFSVHEAIAVKGKRIVRVGSNEAILRLGGADTKVVDLNGRMVLPGLIDSHTHPTGAAMYEFDHRVPTMSSIADVLEHVRDRAEALKDGEWIRISQVFITRLDERRYPTREELDKAAPNNPVVFRTGPDVSLNSPALRRSGIDKEFKLPDESSGKVERDPETGEPTGILRNLRHLVAYEAPDSQEKPTDKDRRRRLRRLFADYNSVGLTSIADRAASGSAVKRYQKLRDAGELSVRMAVSRHLSSDDSLDAIRKRIEQAASHPLARGGPMLRIIGIKMFLDGGMLTGSAYMREPWGKSEIYSIDDPNYRGLRFIPQEKLESIVKATFQSGLQFTAHSVGDGAVHALIDAYQQAAQSMPIRKYRPCITHSNFMSKEAIRKMSRLGIIADIQPAWLYLDGRTLLEQFGKERLEYFQPLASLFRHGVITGGGSDHMQKIGSRRSVNPYNPWLGMWIAMTRRMEGGKQLHREDGLSREQAIRFYTRNNAYLLFLDRDVGSLEKGKLADMIVLDRDILECPMDDFRQAQVLRTYLGGKLVYQADSRNLPSRS